MENTNLRIEGTKVRMDCVIVDHCHPCSYESRGSLPLQEGVDLIKVVACRVDFIRYHPTASPGVCIIPEWSH